MIRQSQSEDMASILALWMKSTIYAHCIDSLEVRH